MFELMGYIRLKPDYSDQVFIAEDKDLNPAHYKELADKIKVCPLRIMDIGVCGDSYLCLAPDSSCLIDVRSKDDVAAMFECSEFNGILCPPELRESWIKKAAYAFRIQTELNKRITLMVNNGADHESIVNVGNVLRNMTIACSLMKGELCDSIYFQYAEHSES